MVLCPILDEDHHKCVHVYACTIAGMMSKMLANEAHFWHISGEFRLYILNLFILLSFHSGIVCM